MILVMPPFSIVSVCRSLPFHEMIRTRLGMSWIYKKSSAMSTKIGDKISQCFLHPFEHQPSKKNGGIGT